MLLRVFILALLLAGPVAGRVFGRVVRRASSIALRQRLFVNPLISDPGTLEVEWNNTLGPGSYYQPQTWKYSVGRTEYSLGFDAVAHDSGATHFSDHLTATATSVLYNGPHLDIAVAPQATFLLRNDSGVRLGATLIARYDFGKNSVSGSFGWTGATVASASNPAGTADAIAGFGRRVTRHITAYASVQWERSSALPSYLSVFEGAEYEISSRLAANVYGQHYTLTHGVPDHHYGVGLTYNFGRIRWR
jgi:hypothetical protein